MAAIPFAVSSAPGVRPQESAGRLKNGFAVKNELGSRFPVSWYRSAGMRELCDVENHIHLRGGIYLLGSLICVFNGRAYTIGKSGASFFAVDRGRIDGSAPITVARNNAATPDIVCVTEDGARMLYLDAAPADFADADLATPNSVSILNGYFIFTHGNGRITASDLNSVSVASNSFTTAQQRAGGLLRGVAYRGEFFAFGPSSVEVYREVGTSPFPLEYDTFIPRGIVGTHAVAGWEEGWSNQLIWVGDDARVYRLVGYTPEPIENDDVSRDIAAAVKAGQGASLEASVYMHGRHAFWRLTNPGVWTWEHNATTGNWNERHSFNRNDARGCSPIRAFDRWVCGDRTSGGVFEIDPDCYREGDDALQFVLRSGVAAAFPSRLEVPRMDLDFTMGIGNAAGTDPIETEPVAKVSLSRDGGNTFTNPMTRKLGKQGQSQRRVTINGCGLTGPKGLVVELEVADPVHVGFHGGQIAVNQRGE